MSVVGLGWVVDSEILIFLFFLAISHALSASGGAIWARELIGNGDTLKTEPHDCTLHLVVPFELKSSLAIGIVWTPRSHPPPGGAIWESSLAMGILWTPHDHTLHLVVPFELERSLAIRIVWTPRFLPSTWWCHLGWRAQWRLGYSEPHDLTFQLEVSFGLESALAVKIFSES